MPTKIIGNLPHQVPRNADLGSIAFQDKENVTVDSIRADVGVTGFLDAQIGISGNTRPSIRPSLSIDFDKTKTLDSRLTWLRASEAYYYDDNITAKSDENLLYYSQDVSKSVWVKGNLSVASNAGVAPDGSFTANILSSTASGTTHYIYQPQAFTGLGVFSSYVKAGTHKFVQMAFGGLDATIYANYDIEKGIAYTANASSGNPQSGITPVGNGWYRIWFTYDNFSNANILFCMVDNQYAGRNASALSTGNYYVWGLQFEARYGEPSSYVYTGSTTLSSNIIPLVKAGSYAARFDCNPITKDSLGLLLEEQRTNSNRFSSELYSSAYTKGHSSIIGNCVIAPDGTMTGSKLVENDQYNSHTIVGYLTGLSIVSGQSYTFSVYAKAGERSGFRLAQTVGVDYAVYFDLATETALSNSGSATGTITPVGGGWYRCTSTFSHGTTTVSSPTIVIYLMPNGNDGGTAYKGDGKSGIYFWGLQAEEGGYVSSYIPTPSNYKGRTTRATYLGSKGYLEIAGPGELRYETTPTGSKAYLTEGASNNTCAYRYHEMGWSTTPYGGSAKSVDLLTNAELAPDGSFSATKFVPRYNTAGTYIWSGLVNSNVTHSLSIFVKYAGYRYVYFGSASDNFGFDLVTNTPLTQNARFKAIPYGNGWYRLMIDNEVIAGGFLQNFWVSDSSSMAMAYPSAGIDTTITNDSRGVYIWGYQIENAISNVSSYIPSVDRFDGRTSIGSYYDANGLLRFAASGQERWTYNPTVLSAAPIQLFEVAKTNVLPFSNTFSSWSSSNATVVSNDAVSPDGKTNASRITASAANGNVYNSGLSIAPTSVMTYSFFAKNGGANEIAIQIQENGAANACNFTFNFISETLSTSQSGTGKHLDVGFMRLPNGWFRFWITCKPSTTGTTTNCNIGLSPYGVVNQPFFLYGAQVEVDGLTSYIPTNGSAVTRSVDAWTKLSATRSYDYIDGSTVTRSADTGVAKNNEFSSWFNPYEGSLFVEASVLSGSSQPATTNTGSAMSVVTIENKDTPANTRFMLRRMAYTAGNASAGSIGILNVRYYDTQSSTSLDELQYSYQNKMINWLDSNYHKYVVGYSANQQYGIFDTIDLNFGSKTIPPLNNANQLRISSGSSAAYWTGYVKRIVYYPKLLSKSELTSLTA